MKKNLSNDQNTLTSIFDCKSCNSIDDYYNFRYYDSKPEFPDLISIYNKWVEEDRHYSFRNHLMKCKLCATFYYNFESVDTEDAFVGGPDLSDDFHRLNLIWLMEVLKKLGLNAELIELNKNYKQIIDSLIKVVTESPERIAFKESGIANTPFYFRYVIESLCDYYIENNDFEGLKSTLLTHDRPEIVFKTIKDIISMYTEKSYDPLFPRYTEYKSISVHSQKRIRPFIKKHIKKIVSHLNRFKDAEDEVIQRQYNSVHSSAIYHKLIE